MTPDDVLELIGRDNLRDFISDEAIDELFDTSSVTVVIGHPPEAKAVVISLKFEEAK